jgi:hypothetical protein
MLCRVAVPFAPLSCLANGVRREHGIEASRLIICGHPDFAKR